MVQGCSGFQGLQLIRGKSTSMAHADAGGEGADSDGGVADQVPAAVKVQHAAGGALVGNINIAGLPGDDHPRVVVPLLAAVVVRAVPLHHEQKRVCKRCFCECLLAALNSTS